MLNTNTTAIQQTNSDFSKDSLQQKKKIQKFINTLKSIIKKDLGADT